MKKIFTNVKKYIFNLVTGIYRNICSLFKLETVFIAVVVIVVGIVFKDRIISMINGIYDYANMVVIGR